MDYLMELCMMSCIMYMHGLAKIVCSLRIHSYNFYYIAHTGVAIYLANNYGKRNTELS